MKKAILAIGVATSLLLLLIGCNGGESEKLEEVPSATIAVEETAPAETPKPEETNEPANQVEQMSVNTQQEADTRREATLMDLLELFQTVYDCRNDWISLGDSEEVLGQHRTIHHKRKASSQRKAAAGEVELNCL